ncbi:MAG: hypothetical protein LBV28_02025 [Puniceicoccales bacterium]|jgi:pullulanase/glycogen debranching enzyme|nr:hypothetical protein [Puniceicoccales bacterium]
MQTEPHRVVSAFWTTRFDGVASLSRDWPDESPPPLALAAPGRLRRLFRMEPRRWARLSGYFFDEGKIVFVLWPELYPHTDCRAGNIRVAGPFNQWAPDDAWTLKPEIWEGDTVFVLRTGATDERQLFNGTDVPDGTDGDGTDFKFVAQGSVWLEVPTHAPNRRGDGRGHFNFHLDCARTGRHVFCFVAEAPACLTGHDALVWDADENRHTIPVGHGDFLLQQDTTLEMGARVRDGKTRFRLFAPRATGVVVELTAPTTATSERHALTAHADGVWEWERAGSLHGWRYRYFIQGENGDASTAFDATVPVLDPWALAVATAPTGAGLVVDTARIAYPQSQYQPPAPTDLVIVEAHVRDLVARLPGVGAQAGFREMAAWIRSPDCYLRKLGVNAIELQPVQAFDGTDAAVYHWGYMPVNWFAPAGAYAADAAAGTQIADLQALVEACHEAGLAVILDVVYNHVGEPNHLCRIDKSYYLETTREGGLTNWSGCGNDVRATAPMVRRLVLDSLRHLVECFDVDGFRFDLAELLGVPLLHTLERELRTVKPSLVLIAEPWSYRGHIGQALLHTGFTSWNDGYREFFPAYVHGAAGADTLRYFLSGSPSVPSASPAHTLNYTESHDDRCWLDRITENAANDGTDATPADARRTRIMAAALFASLGVPMLAAGQDFLRTKGGLENTYLRGDVNALDYTRLAKFGDTHAYFRGWIAFRLGAAGAALRLRERPEAGFFRFFQEAHSHALAAWYNADARLAVTPLFFALNPHPHPVALRVVGVDAGGFRQLADGDTFCADGLPEDAVFAWRGGILTLPALSAGLWVAG